MFAALRASSSRSVSRSASRAFSSSAAVFTKLPLRPSTETATPADLLAKIGRNADKKLGEVESWDALSELYFKGGPAFEKAGLGIKDRRYILWALSRYSLGDAPSTFITPVRPPKKFRGWGARVQHGVRIK